MKKLTEQIIRFETLEESVRKKIQESIHNESKNVATYVGRTVGDAASKEIKTAVKKLEDATADASNTLSRYQASHELSQWKIIGVTVFSTVLTCLLIVKFLMPIPVIPFTHDQMATYQSGQVLESVWPKLSARQKQWFLDVAAGKAKNHEKLVEDMKKDYSTSNNDM